MEPSKQALNLLALWLIPGLGPHRINRLLQTFGDVEGVLKAPIARLTGIKGITSPLAASIASAQESAEFERECRLIEKYRLTIVSIADSQYPNRLREIYASPPILYMKGEIAFNRGIYVGIVGSRKASYSGTSFCKKLVRQLARFSSDIVIVSGLALGIDAAAHRSALECGLRTVAVLAGGLSGIYPHQHRDLSLEISSHGALTTEFPIMTKPSPGNFPLRNRIISGTSHGVIVVEADTRSGALITAGYALEQNRELFAVPGQVDSRYYRGTNNLIQRGHAKLIMGAEDVIEELQPALIPEKENREKSKTENVNNLSTDEMAILKILEDKCMHSDALATELNMPVQKVLAVLTTMEMKGLIAGKAGSQFQRIE